MYDKIHGRPIKNARQWNMFTNFSEHIRHFCKHLTIVNRHRSDSKDLSSFILACESEEHEKPKKLIFHFIILCYFAYYFSSSMHGSQAVRERNPN